ncbi:MAG: hypothetical protein J0M12_00020 [Deltaproteobacteria bacterium]|nr:hypothetical protein [Deltaproteobacteria bacterium]
MKQLLPALLLATLLTAIGCGPKVVKSPALDNGTPKAVAVLPVNYPSGVQRERVDYIRASLISELRRKGFIVLDESAINAVCSTPDCPRSKELASKYLADGIVTLHLDSVARNNFLAGYYNTITGDLSLKNREGVQLIEVKHTESERGGLLFNTGQLIQGVISQLNNSEKSSFSRLADKFTDTLVSKIPPPEVSATEDEGSTVAIKSIKLTPLKGGGDEICAYATPGSMAFVLLPGQRSNLREVQPGEYCSRLRIADAAGDMSNISVEVRSPYGKSARKALKSDYAVCDLDGLLNVRAQGASQKLVLECRPADSACDSRFQNCGAHRFIIYRAANPLGPYTKVAEVQSLSWPIPKRDLKDSATYRVVAVDKHGNFSVPAAISPASGQSAETGRS